MFPSTIQDHLGETKITRVIPTPIMLTVGCVHDNTSNKNMRQKKNACIKIENYLPQKDTLPSPQWMNLDYSITCN